MNFWPYVLLALVAAQRLIEIVYAERNTRALFARGAIEIGHAHYPFIVILHAAWLATIAALLPRHATIYWLPLAFFGLLQLGRVWVIATLGPYWTTRIVTLESAPLVSTGPYRFLRHPNYVVVVGEIVTLPLAFGEVRVALVFSVLNAALLAWRIREEDAALAARRMRMPANQD